MEQKQEEFAKLSRLIDYLEENFEDIKFDLQDEEVVFDSVKLIDVGDVVIVGCLKYDSDPQDYFENDEGAGEFFQFRSVDERDEKMKELKKDKKLFYLVNKYEHGSVHYSVAGTKLYPDERWDVSHGSCIFVPCDYIQQEYKKLAKKEGKEKASEKFESDSNIVLDNYSDFCNGEVYGYSVKVFDKKTGSELECDECWGFIGHKYAEEEKDNVMKYHIEKEMKKTVENKPSKPKM